MPPYPDFTAAVTRRRALVLGGGMAGGLVAAAAPLAGIANARDMPRRQAPESQSGALPVEKIEQFVQAKGTVTKGVLKIDIERKDIGAVEGPMGVTFKPAFEIHGDVTFQPLGRGRAFVNADMALKEEETNRFIDALLANGLIFQAFHQHYDGMHPQIWFIHYRGIGDPLALARAVHNAIKVTSTPLPQAPPPHPTTPLDPERLARILHGDAEVGDEGVVTVTVDRTDTIIIDGIRVSPEANISTNIEFKPLNSSGTRAAAAPDFSMTSQEVQPVVATMRRYGFDVGCLYNQETNEHPQLFFSHMLKVGNPYTLAAEIRQGLNHTNVE